MRSDSVLALLKFGPRQYIEPFVSEGLLYMNHVEYFSALEAGPERCDPNEGSLFMLQPRGVRIGFRTNPDEPYKSVGKLVRPVLFRGRTSSLPNIFCMHGVRASTATSLVDPRNFKFGDTFVLLKDGNEFLKRAVRTARDHGLEMRCRPVEYVDEVSQNGRLGPFRKYSRFSYESEVRLTVSPGIPGHRELRLGDLSDIVAMTGRLDAINDHIKLIPE